MFGFRYRSGTWKICCMNLASTSATSPSSSGGTDLCPIFASEIRKRRVEDMKSTHCRWHIDEISLKINGNRHYLWRSVDHEGEALESSVTKTNDKTAALKFLNKAMRKHGQPETIVTDKLRSYGAALKELGADD